MKSRTKKFLSIVILSLLLIVNICNFTTVSAYNSSSQSYNALCQKINEGKSSPYSLNGDKNGESVQGLDFSGESFKCSGGGYKTWMELTDTKEVIKEESFNKLTAGEKQAFLKCVMKICNQEVAANDNGSYSGITTETVNDVLEQIQDKTGMGSQLLATLLSETKPDYASATQIYKPFSGPIGTALGFISILIMSLLALTMALDIAYIVIPAFQLMLSGENGEGGGQGAQGISRIISSEARNAVQAAESGGGAGGQSGSGNKMAVGLYFKARWKGLVVLGICLLYLVQGQIYSFVAWIIDLMSGFLGF